MRRFEEVAVRPGDRAPVIDRRGTYCPQRGGDHRKVRELVSDRVDHRFEVADVQRAEVGIGIGDLEAECGQESLLVAYHQVGMLGEPPVDLLRASLSTDIAPEAGPVIK